MYIGLKEKYWKKQGTEKNGLVVLVQLADNVLACINGTLDFFDCIIW